MDSGPHRAVRPVWVCGDCGEPWPCQRRREMFLSQRPFNRLGLLMFLARLMYDAIEDLHRQSCGPTSDLYGRFVGWARRAEPDDGGKAGSRPPLATRSQA